MYAYVYACAACVLAIAAIRTASACARRVSVCIRAVCAQRFLTAEARAHLRRFNESGSAWKAFIAELKQDPDTRKTVRPFLDVIG